MWEGISKEFIICSVSCQLKRRIDTPHFLKNHNKAVCHCRFAATGVLDPGSLPFHTEVLCFTLISLYKIKASGFKSISDGTPASSEYKKCIAIIVCSFAHTKLILKRKCKWIIDLNFSSYAQCKPSGTLFYGCHHVQEALEEQYFSLRERDSPRGIAASGKEVRHKNTFGRPLNKIADKS